MGWSSNGKEDNHEASPGSFRLSNRAAVNRADVVGSTHSLRIRKSDTRRAAMRRWIRVALDQLVAPIALYPDPLVAQILTASTYPQQVSDADNWSQQNAGMPPQQRADIANGMPWDPSVKALTAFPSVLDNMARNYNWTSALGNAYYNQPGDVMNAVQAARCAGAAGGLFAIHAATARV